LPWLSEDEMQMEIVRNLLGGNYNREQGRQNSGLDDW
jgi:hypothetical protein